MAARLRLGAREFERVVEEALRSLPAGIRARLDNVLIAIEPEPSDEDYEKTDTPEDEELLGIFRGAMLTESSFGDLPQLPPQVIVFRGPILRCSETRAEAIAEIQETVLHELGHLFGLEDDDMPY